MSSFLVWSLLVLRPGSSPSQHSHLISCCASFLVCPACHCHCWLYPAFVELVVELDRYLNSYRALLRLAQSAFTLLLTAGSIILHGRIDHGGMRGRTPYDRSEGWPVQSSRLQRRWASEINTPQYSNQYFRRGCIIRIDDEIICSWTF